MADFSMTFPAGYLWGTATSAHQVEGENTNNSWYAWETSGPGHIFENQQSGLACEWWNGRYAEDFDRAVEMHNNALRLSIEWSRIEPEPGVFDHDALARYGQMIGALRERGLEPMVTLHHFCNPLWLEKDGGWTQPGVVARFEGYVRHVIDALGDQVTMWCTINEPMVYATLGYLLGRFPPGKRSMPATCRVIEHMLRGHAAAYHAIKELQPDAQVGFAKSQISLQTRFPKCINQGAVNTVWNFFNAAFVEALMTGRLRLPLRHVDAPEARDTLDWIGLNYYYRFLVFYHLLAPQRFFLQQTKPRDGIQGPGDVGEIWPEGVYEHIQWLYETTGKPLYITESGVPDADDSLRPLHIVRSLRSVWQALNNNYPVKGFFFWTLVDNFEWAEGYDPRFRFGLYECSHKSQARTKRRSAELYGEICEANALTGAMVQRYLPDQVDELFPGVDVQAEVELPPR
jgi:beta-glucosidase